MTCQFENRLLEIYKNNSTNLLFNEPMKNHTSFKIGGNASYLVMPTSIKQIADTIKLSKEFGIPCFIMGNGSNLLVDDAGYFGIIIKLSNNFSSILVDSETITAKSGASLSKIAKTALDASLSGFEFASGIPGTLGGAVKMNAGAYGGEMKDVVISTDYMDFEGNVYTLAGEEQGFAYRESAFSEDNIILSSKIKLKKGNKDEILERMRSINGLRSEKQPLEFPSAGSAFKRPKNAYAAKLIDDCCLKGYRFGGAMVSEKHCGFVINKNNATFNDVITLLEHIKKTVYDKTGIMLNEEVKILRNLR